MKTLRHRWWMTALATAVLGIVVAGCTVNEDTKPDTTVVTPGHSTTVVPVPAPV